MPRKSKEEEREYQRKYYQKNKERIKKRRAERYNKEYFAEWRDKNREKYSAYQKAYREKRKKKNEPCHSVPNEKHPDFETDAGDWWLCKKGEKYSIWRFDSKRDETYKTYLILRNDGSEIVAEDHTLVGIGIKHDIYEQLY